MKRLVIVCFALICLLNNSNGQETWQIVIEDDTLSEVGREVLEIKGHLYIINRTRCQPNAQSCGVLLKYDPNGNLIWSLEMPDIKMGNDNIIHSYGGNIIVTGRTNDGTIPLNFGFYEIDTSGELLDFTITNLLIKATSTTGL